MAFDEKAYLKNYVRKRVLYDKEYHRKRHLKRRYNLTVKQYEEMCQGQNKCCLICGKERKLVVDHEHESGKIRGLLCTGCNAALHIIEDTERLKRAMNYLKEHV